MKPNIVIVLVDALRPKNLSLYGYNKETDKNIKKIASESVVFTKSFSTSNASHPSWTSIFSGLYPINHGIIHQYPNTEKQEIDKLRKIKFWLPTYLQKQGYETIAIGSMDLWLKKGFDYYKKQEGELGYYRKFVNNRMIKKILLKFPNFLYSFGKKIIKRDPALDFPKPEETFNLTISKIKETQKKKGNFFMFIYFEDTHFPYPRIKAPKVKGKISAKNILDRIKDKSQREYVKKRFVDIKLKYLEQIKAKYDKAIEEIDNQLGKLHSFLKKEHLWDNTIFIILSDHGDSIDEHEIYFSHAGLYDEVLHVPLIMHLPGIKPKKISELIQTIDVAPTILKILGEEKLKIDGISLINLIKTGKPIRDKIFAYDGVCKSRKAVRTETKKLIKSENGKCYLCGAKHGEKMEEYNLRKDQKEEKNIYSGKSRLEKFLKH